MISSATFHVITTELVVGSFAMAGVWFFTQSDSKFQRFDLRKNVTSM